MVEIGAAQSGTALTVVILLEVNDESYPANDLSRRLLHVAMTRVAHQLWITMTGRPRHFCQTICRVSLGCNLGQAGPSESRYVTVKNLFLTRAVLRLTLNTKP